MVGFVTMDTLHFKRGRAKWLNTYTHCCRLSSTYFDEQGRQVTEKRLIRKLEKVGYQVSVFAA